MEKFNLTKQDMYNLPPNVPITMNEFIIKLMPYLPNYYQGSVEVNAIQNGFEVIVGQLRFDIKDLLDQLFIQTATWGLTMWEEMLGISVDGEKPYEQRRERLVAKLRGTGTSTKKMLINTASSFSGGEVDIIEYPKESRFEVHFVGTKGIPKDLPALTATINEIKPAHLGFTYKYTYNVWGDLITNKWLDVSGLTWEELRVK